MNKETFEENDRNIRVFGLETQKKLLESEVLIMNLTPMMGELCKNLILSGAGICLLDDGSLINKKDSDNSFFFNINDLGKKKAEIFKEKIKMFKESSRINIIKDVKEIKQKCLKYGVIDLSEVNFEKEKRKAVENIMIENKGVFYYVKIDNDKAIFLNNILEKKFMSENSENKGNNNETLFVKDEKIIDHMDLSDDESVNSDNKNNKLNEAENTTNTTKTIEISNNNEDDDEKEQEILKEDDYAFLDLEKKIREIRELVPKNMKKFDESVINDALKFIDENNAITQRIIHPLSCLCNHVIGGVVCHEIINCISKKKNPRTNIYYYDAFNGVGKFFNELYDKVLK